MLCPRGPQGSSRIIPHLPWSGQGHFWRKGWKVPFPADPALFSFSRALPALAVVIILWVPSIFLSSVSCFIAGSTNPSDGSPENLIDQGNSGYFSFTPLISSVLEVQLSSRYS